MKEDEDGSKIYLDPIFANPFSFCIGGIGAVGVGSITDDYRRNSVRFEDDGYSDFLNSTLRSLSAPLKSALRFCLGGLVRVLLDIIMVKTIGRKIPAASGGVLGMLIASGSRSGVFWGCTLGLALFFELADYIFYKAQR